MLNWLKALSGSRRAEHDAPPPVAGQAQDSGLPVSRDTLAAISELSRVVRNNPDAVEIYLALGNLYRAQGEIERAVQIRQNLIVRPGLDTGFKAKAWFELGMDFKRGGFLDRAIGAFEQARKIEGDTGGIILELARLAALSGDFAGAAKHYASLDYPLAEAHYLVRLAQEAGDKGQESESRKWLDKALKVYPASVEGWLERLVRLRRAEQHKAVAENLEKALGLVQKRLRFVLLEGLLADAAPRGGAACPATGQEMDRPFSSTPDSALADAVLPVLAQQEPDLLISFYAAWFAAGLERELALTWLEKTLVVNPGFWPARLELLIMAAQDQDLAPAFRTQLEFFSARAREIKRFVCRTCGLKREQIFFVCPRCLSWHSIGYRLVINE
ncbi:MAG: tetratricopeptide repeat protein [Thermodesulfobacteriota bacterium]